MLLPCEVAVRSVVPAIRSAVARELTQSYGLKQKDVAILLGVTQTAVSKYTRQIRGTVLKVEDIKEVQPILKEVIISLTERRMSKYELVEKLCTVCQVIREKGLMCEICRRSDPSIDIQQCFICRCEGRF
jgi:predicted transcriptional regulator